MVRGHQAGHRFDVAVVGAGPGGSLAAYRLARAGADVVLLERHRFPRDKPCGGGVTTRAARQLPFAIDPVVEDVVDRFRVGLRYGRSFCHPAPCPLVYMTQRKRLDAFLAGQAAGAGADLREGVRASAVAREDGGAVVHTNTGAVRARLVVGADGVNGATARSLGMHGERTFAVALEGNLPLSQMDEGRYRGRAVIELGTVPGGYAWVFVKGDHANFGVAGWEAEGPRLRRHLQTLCAVHGTSAGQLTDVRGYRIPARAASARLAQDRTLLVGDAGGLADPLSGDGMYEAFLSANIAADTACEVLDGKPALEIYDPRVRKRLNGLVAASWDAKLAVDRFPAVAFALLRPRAVWSIVERVLTGDLQHQHEARGIARLPIEVLAMLARATGSPGSSYRATRPA